MAPPLRAWLLDPGHRLIHAGGPSIEAREHRAHHKPARIYVPTEAGREVLAADGARRLEQAKREIVAESVARHAGLP